MRSAIGKLIITTLATVLLVEICYAQATGGGGRYGPALSRGCRKRGFDGSLSKSDGAELGTYFGGRAACAKSEQWALRALARYLIIRAAVIRTVVTILLGVGVAVR
jgi:hypothetical protein